MHNTFVKGNVIKSDFNEVHHRNTSSFQIFIIVDEFISMLNEVVVCSMLFLNMYTVYSTVYYLCICYIIYRK